MDRVPRLHDLKCWPEYFEAVDDGRKGFEVRENDRDFATGDYLLLREWTPQFESCYTGRWLIAHIGYCVDLAVIDSPKKYVGMDVCVVLRPGDHEETIPTTLPRWSDNAAPF